MAHLCDRNTDIKSTVQLTVDIDRCHNVKHPHLLNISVPF
ncbi:hypothetical protein V12B01_13520 [Vibrio splendidus 12B01]|nr:hypothetical protein V12B01_13520 [Vibrio splendidus 12B01]